jgi:CRISPR-associated protein Cas5t
MNYESGRHQLKVGTYGICRGISTVELLVDVELLLHIIPTDQTLVEEIEKAFLFPIEYPSLGRREDIVTIHQAKVVEIISDRIDETIDMFEVYSAYIPLEEMEKIRLKNREEGVSISGTRYRLNKNYELFNIGTKNKPKYIRKWNKVDVVYGSNISVLRKKIVTMDEDQNILFAI